MSSILNKILLATVLTLSIVPTTAALESSDIPSQIRVFEDTSDIRKFTVTDIGNSSDELRLRARGELSDIVDSVNRSTGTNDDASVPVRLNLTNSDPGIYSGSLYLSDARETESYSVTVQVLETGQGGADAELRLSSDVVGPDKPVTFFVVLSSPSRKEVKSRYLVRESSTGEPVANLSQSYEVSGTQSFRLNLSPKDSYEPGSYYLQGRFRFDGQPINAAQPFRVESSFWRPLYSRLVVTLASGSIVILGGWRLRKRYKSKRKEEARYVAPSDYSSLPAESDDNYWVGKVAESEKQAFIDPDDLTTHAIVSGSTGSGKSVTASVIIEEALKRDVPVVCFDPTAQWTGFVKELRDDNLFEHYERFDMDDDTDPRPYPGTIKQIQGPDPDIDFKDLQNDGEITVFTLDQLSTEEFDEAVRGIIDQIFEEDWEESPSLEMLIVFDEVHRLLEEYGGEGGYQALEKGAREFRKWGIGLMMCSQVTADFKQAISGNIMTEIQLQTKSMEDIKRVKKKYGPEFAEKLSSEDVGTGMIQNSNYNDGEPWFVDFRPTYHNPHKIPDEEMQKYQKLSRRVDKVREAINQKEAAGEDMQDQKLELDLADGKLKEGRFKMTSMYLDTLQDELDVDTD